MNTFQHKRATTHRVAVKKKVIRQPALSSKVLVNIDTTSGTNNPAIAPIMLPMVFMIVEKTGAASR
jgi:hypothetical protein